MSDSGRNPGAARAAALELETLVVRLGEEIASFRRRAQVAEARVKALEEELEQVRDEAAQSAREAAERLASAASHPAPADVATAPEMTAEDSGRVASLQQENEELRARLEGAAGRTRQMLERLRFLRQQHSLGGSR